MSARTMPRTTAGPATRAAIIAKTRELLDWLEKNPEIPLRKWGHEILVGADGRDAVEDLADAMGVTAEHTSSSHRAIKPFGAGVAYVAYAQNVDAAS